MIILSECLETDLRLRLRTGEIVYGKVFPEGEGEYAVYGFFGGKKRTIPAETVVGCESFRPVVLGEKVRRYDDLTELCGEDPAFHMKVLGFMTEILAEALSERDELDGKSFPGGKKIYLESAEKEARERADAEK
ncbi:MAG: hypothetical protein LUD72_05200 [Bacteroidales bacterium]|nr:hypothetical protein [Bacteroidales bacterium]